MVFRDPTNDSIHDMGLLRLTLLRGAYFTGYLFPEGEHLSP